MNWNEIKKDITFNDIKEMEYKVRIPSDRFDKPSKYEILCQSWYKGYKVLIVSYFNHPCAYVGLPSGHIFELVDYDYVQDIDCHGGITYGGDHHALVKELQDSGWFIGWDYAHFGDWCAHSPILGGKKWTTMEIINECMSVVDQLIEIQAANQRKLEELKEESK